MRFCVFIVHKFWLFQPIRDLKLWGNRSSVCTITYLIVWSRRQITQQKTVGYTRCVSVPINWLWSEIQLCTKRADLHYVMGQFEENNVPVLELLVSAKVAVKKEVVLNVKSAQSWCLLAVAISTNTVELQICLHESSKINKYVVPLFHKESVNSIFTPWTNSRLSFSFCIVIASVD